MRAHCGDWIVVHGYVVGGADRRCQVLEVHGTDGAPPYVVRWTGDDHLSTFVPGPDATVLEERRSM